MDKMEIVCPNCFQTISGGGAYCPCCGYDQRSESGKYPMALRPGSVLNGKYVIGRVLGQGGFGITYLGLDTTLNIRIAVKEFMPEGIAVRAPGDTCLTLCSRSAEEPYRYGMECFLNEAQVLAKFIGHPNIVGARSYFEENGTAYLVMDYVEGISFKSYIREHGGRVSWQEALRILFPVMEALEAVHHEGILHRDVTPDNIYLTPNGTVKLLDFGAARYSMGDRSRSLDVILKPGFAPKEQYMSKSRQGPYTDVYSVAACFYASITGVLPPESLERMEHDELIPFSARGIQLPAQLEQAVLKGLAVNSGDRFRTMGEFLDAVRPRQADPVVPPVRHEVPVTPEPPVPPTSPEPPTAAHTSGSGWKGKALAGAAAAAIILTGTVVGFRIGQSRNSGYDAPTAGGYEQSEQWEEPPQELPQEEQQIPVIHAEYENPEEDTVSYAPEPTVEPQRREYILEGSDSRYVSVYELSFLTQEELKLARNELYARHGRKFNDIQLSRYFEQFDWYVPMIDGEDFTQDMLNEYELANAELIVEYERECGYRD